MTRGVPIGMAAALVVCGLSAQTTLGPAQFSQDLQAVVTQLPALHVDLFFQTPQADFNAAAQQLQSDLPKLSQYQFYTRLAALVAMARDGHTYLSLSADAGFTQLPVTLEHFSDGYFVTSAPADTPSLNRAKLVSVGGTPVDQALAALEPVISHENEYRFQAWAAQYLTNLGVMRGLGFLPDTGAASYTFRLDSGAEISVDLASATTSQTRALDSPAGFIPPLESTTGNDSSTYWPQSRTVYVRIASFAATDGGQQFAAQTLGLLDQNAVDSLIFDLRNDEGGDLTMVFPLLQGLTSRLATLQTSPRFQTYALINGGSYSSATYLPMILKAGVPDFLAPLAPGIGSIPTTLVGEPTGGPPRQHGNPATFKLPASGMAVQYSTVYSPAFPGIPDLDAVYPDIAAPVESTDYFARHDAILAAVLARASAPPAPPTGADIVVNSASYRNTTGIAPGSYASALGAFPSGPLAVSINGSAATLLAATGTQLVFVVPAAAAVGTAQLTVSQGGQTISSGQFPVTQAGPGLFAVAPTAAQPGAIVNEDYSLNSSASPAARGSVVQIFATGYGPLDGSGQAAASVWVGNLPAVVLSSGPAPGYPNLWQIKARIPDDPTIAGQVPIFVSTLGMVSNAVTVFVQP